jgi:dTDP-4-dehydrorhamnose reductase
MNVLILGGGYIGNHIFNTLKNYHNVEQITQSQVNYTLSDNSTSMDFKSFLHDKRFDVVVNCSGYTGKPNVDACESDKANCWEYNVLAPTRTTETVNLFRMPMIHISSGCIYQGDKKYNEEDIPNFGLYDDHSSFYSKSKHAGELALRDMYGYILRIRMPFCSSSSPKNILNKYLKYENIVSMPNSLTCVHDLAKAVEHICVHRNQVPKGIYNVVNKGKVEARQVLQMFKRNGIGNRNWKIVPIEELDIKAGRSNCTLSGKKLSDAGFSMPHAEASLESCIRSLNERLFVKPQNGNA